jgi:hypothetical protein
LPDYPDQLVDRPIRTEPSSKGATDKQEVVAE